MGAFHYAKDSANARSEVKWKDLSVSAFSERNIRDHCWRLSTYFAVPFLTSRFIALLFFTYVGNLEKK